MVQIHSPRPFLLESAIFRTKHQIIHASKTVKVVPACTYYIAIDQLALVIESVASDCLKPSRPQFLRPQQLPDTTQEPLIFDSQPRRFTDAKKIVSAFCVLNDLLATIVITDPDLGIGSFQYLCRVD